MCALLQEEIGMRTLYNDRSHSWVVLESHILREGRELLSLEGLLRLAKKVPPKFDTHGFGGRKKNGGKHIEGGTQT